MILEIEVWDLEDPSKQLHNEPCTAPRRITSSTRRASCEVDQLRAAYAASTDMGDFSEAGAHLVLVLLVLELTLQLDLPGGGRVQEKSHVESAECANVQRDGILVVFTSSGNDS